MPTLFQMTKNWLAKKAGEKLPHYNPLCATSGVIVTIDTLDYHKKHFVVTEVRDYKRIQRLQEVGGIARRMVESHWTDYALTYSPVDSDNIETIILRCKEDCHDFAIVLKKDDEQPYSDGLLAATKEEFFEIANDGKLVAKYQRIEPSAREPYDCVVTTVLNGAATKVDRVDVSDYHRDATDEAGQSRREYYFVEQNRLTGQFLMYLGYEVTSQRIVALS